MSKPEVLVVHCVDTEGPIGGNVRRWPDGSKEFMDNWRDINRSLRQLTNRQFRQAHADSFGNPYLFNWFIMDFTGFRTNPKKRITKYNDTYDHLKALPTKPDAFYWHYHHSPASGAGDKWSADWDSNDEYKNILLHRLVERADWPEAYRAGGTIEDNKASHWLEDTIMIDYSNRVSDHSRPTKDILDFNWHGAPDDWGYYHPSRRDLLRPGKMKRFIIRSVDLWSRLHELTVGEVEEAFAQAERMRRPVILSYFSHDHRDMNDETHYAINLIKLVSTRRGIPWRVCSALGALQRSAGIKLKRVRVTARRQGDKLHVTMSAAIYQPLPWVGAQLHDRSLAWLPVQRRSGRTYEVVIPDKATKIVIGGTSRSGDKFVKQVAV